MIWILCANSAQATLFSADSPSASLKDVVTLTNPDARAKESDLVSDRPGRTFDSHGAGRHAKEPEVSAKEQAQIRFARSLAERLEQGRVGHAFERLVLVAAPAFLGVLRGQFGEPLRSRVSLEIDADYTALAPGALRQRLPERL